MRNAGSRRAIGIQFGINVQISDICGPFSDEISIGIDDTAVFNGIFQIWVYGKIIKLHSTPAINAINATTAIVMG